MFEPNLPRGHQTAISRTKKQLKKQNTNLAYKVYRSAAREDPHLSLKKNWWKRGPLLLESATKGLPPARIRKLTAAASVEPLP